ncbi:MAG: SpoIIE family protein phosphatase [Acidimicrobiales bacterium]|nr:SpoIIE family protein phosphatase [Acidimicrobiales bacterium]
MTELANAGQSGNDRRLDVVRIVEHGPFGYLTVGSDDIIDGVNTTLTEWLGFDENDIVGSLTVQDLLAPGDRIYFDTHVRPMLSLNGKVNEIAVQLQGIDGNRLPVLMYSVLHPHSDGDTRTEAMFVEAAERRSYEQELLYERRSAEAAEARLQVMYDVVSGLAGSASMEDIVKVVTERGERSVVGASCSLWVFGEDLRTVTRSRHDGGAATSFELTGTGPALGRLVAGDVLEIDDVDRVSDDYPILCEMLQDGGYRSAAIAPLSGDGALFGAISYGFALPHQFDDAERRAVASLAEQTEQAVQRVRAVEAERQSRDRLDHLLRFSTALSAAVSLEDVVLSIEADSVALLGAQHTSLALLTEDGSSVRLLRSDDIDTDRVLDLSAGSAECFVIRSGETVDVVGLDRLRTGFPESDVPAQTLRTIGLPLIGEARVIGAWMLTFATGDRPEFADGVLLQLLAEQASRAVNRALMHRAEAEARTRADLRLAVSESLNAAATTEEVAEAAAVQGREAFGAVFLAMYLRDQDRLELLATTGNEDGENWQREALHTDHLFEIDADAKAPVYLDRDGLDALPHERFPSSSWQAAAILPLAVSGDLVGMIVLGFDDSALLTPGIRAAVAGLAAEAGAAIGRAQRFDLERSVATTLQQSLLPPGETDFAGFELSTCYVPGTAHLVVGGDLFDVVSTRDGGTHVIVGDVVGHGLAAAASMGQLRSAARALALACSGPLEVLRSIEAFVRITPGTMWATIACVTLGPDGDGQYACAGHPYPILSRADGRTEVLKDGRSALLGLGREAPEPGRFHLAPGDALALYTDGLIELDRSSGDDGLPQLRSVLTEAHRQGRLEAGTVVETVMGGARPPDDIVLVCVSRIEGQVSSSIDPGNS